MEQYGRPELIKIECEMFANFGPQLKHPVDMKELMASANAWWSVGRPQLHR